MTLQELLDYLDGRGIVVTDDDLICEALSKIGYAPFDKFERITKKEALNERIKLFKDPAQDKLCISLQKAINKAENTD